MMGKERNGLKDHQQKSFFVRNSAFRLQEFYAKLMTRDLEM